MERRLTEKEKGEIFNMMDGYSSTKTGEVREFIRKKLYVYIERLIKEIKENE